MDRVNSKQYLTVSAINKYLKAKFEQDKYLRKVYIKGEISNLKKHYTGHYYFTLKDESSRINGIMFQSNVANLAFEVEEGMQVLISGTITVYENGGSYTLQAHTMEMDGIGNLYLMIEKTKKKLFEEGLFDEHYKKPIPKYPHDIGVLAADSSAALKDIINTINRRYPIARIHLFHIPVQGDSAYKKIIEQLNYADSKNMDVLLLARGGGSLEDLMNFNEEKLVRCIFALKTPIITGVGHEIDYTLVDYVSDLRAPTPTGAAMLCSVDLHDLTMYLALNEKQLIENMQQKMMTYKEKMHRYEKIQLVFENQIAAFSTKLNSLNQKIHYLSTQLMVNKENEINLLQIRMKNALTNQVMLSRMQLNRYIDELTILSPLNTLKRGYSIVSSQTKPINSIYDIQEEDEITLLMHDGKLHGKLKGIKYE